MRLLIIDRKVRKFIKNQTLSIIINELKKENVEIKWLLIDPEIKTRDGKKNEIDFKEINSVSGNILTKTICLIYILDYASIYKAVLSKIDPSPVSSIDYIKSRLNNE